MPMMPCSCPTGKDVRTPLCYRNGWSAGGLACYLSGIASVMVMGADESAEKSSVQADLEIQTENVVGVLGRTASGRPRELAVIGEFYAEIVVDDVANAGAQSQRVNPVRVEAVKWLNESQAIPRFGLPGA